MRLAFLSIVATRALQLAPQRQQRRSSHSSKQLDDVDADFRRLLATGLTPTDAFTPVDVAALTLRALRSGDERFLHRFSTPDFAPAGVKRRGSTFEGLSNGQYALLREEYTADLDDDVLVDPAVERVHQADVFVVLSQHVDGGEHVQQFIRPINVINVISTEPRAGGLHRALQGGPFGEVESF